MRTTLKNEFGEKRFNNDKRKHAIKIIAPSNRYVYVTTKQRSFIGYICQWVRVIHKSYILRIYDDGNLSCFWRGPFHDVMIKIDEERGFKKSVESMK